MKPLWTPDQDTVENANITHYRRWLEDRLGRSFDNYPALWKWSVEERDGFWESLWHYFDILHDGQYQSVTNGKSMPETRWFEGTSLNYAEHVFRKRTDRVPAILCFNESGKRTEVSWLELEQSVSCMQQLLRSVGVSAGDTVAAYLPCTAEATIAFLAANSLGAVWSSCSPEFGTGAVVDRFAQIKPKVLVAVDQYKYGGKTFDRRQAVSELISRLPSLEHVVLVSNEPLADVRIPISLWKDVMDRSADTISFTRVPFSHPIWVLYSSGTTGLPKAIVHGHGGILLEQLKYGTLHNDFKPADRCFWFTTTGWMMWNYIHGSLLAGGTMVLYDGSPAFPDLETLWQLIDQAKIHHFGTSAGFLLACRQAGLVPAKLASLESLRSIGSTGSTLPPEGFEWVYQAVKKDVWLASMSGGTDVCSAFVGGNPTLPVYAGEIQCRALGCRLVAYDEQGHEVEDTVGEMVITEPMPSMPVYFWNDPHGKRYRESYFEDYPGIWRHGDWIRITPGGGVVIYGRSDATLNRGGVRMGTSEIYSAVATVTEIKDSLIICVEREGGQFWMPLFVVMEAGQPLTQEIKLSINTALRTLYSPRHVPDEIIAVPGVPYTLSGKKTETPVKKLFMGLDAGQVVNKGALRNPETMDFFIALAKEKTT